MVRHMKTRALVKASGWRSSAPIVCRLDGELSEEEFLRCAQKWPVPVARLAAACAIPYGTFVAANRAWRMPFALRLRLRHYRCGIRLD